MLTKNQRDFYHENGFLLLDSFFSKEEVNRLYVEVPSVKAEDSPGRILEKSGGVRSVFDLHKNNPAFSIASRLERLVNAATDLLESKVYIHQSKLNTKEAIDGDWWQWHQDFPYWNIEDGMPSPRVLTVMLFLDEMNDYNGPLFVVPGSHTDGIASMEGKDKKQEENWYNDYQKSTDYMSALTSDLKYTIDKKALKEWIKKKEIISIKGQPGSVLFFHGNLFHSSNCNMSPWDRNTFLVTYNSVENKLVSGKGVSRPTFLAERDFEPLEPIPDNSLIEAKASVG